jgi:ribulose-5-phosphate 4-epimerase/fuculose-1-phosphate aldolase
MTTAELFSKYESKLRKSGLSGKDSALLACVDARIEWNQEHPACATLNKVIEHLNINALICAQPAEPYRSIIDYLAETCGDIIFPQDCETRTFLHDLPLTFEFTAAAIISALKRRKSVIVPGKGVVTYGRMGLEQAFVTFSSVCFAVFVKFFSDFLADARQGKINRRQQIVFDRVATALDPPQTSRDILMKGPFDSEDAVYAAVQEAGKQVVEHRLVDSFFGNISYLYNNTLYISQTGSNLDDLKGCIDPCPLDGSSCAGITASSEFPTHLEIVTHTSYRAILHGHPKFTVILSMDCDVEDCENRGQCHLKCPQDRFACGIPVVPGEVGAGRNGLCQTVPAMFRNQPNVIVYGHGIFTAGKTDFNRPFNNLLEIEKSSRKAYFKRLQNLI